MFKIVNSFTGEIIEKTVSVTYVKMQEHETKPTICETYEEADGVLLSNGIDYLGIEGRNMQGFVPLVTVEEVSSDPYIFRDLDTVKQHGANASTQLDEQQQLQLAGMQGQTDTYATILQMQDVINSQQQLILANMQGLSDVYATLLSMQINGTEA